LGLLPILREIYSGLVCGKAAAAALTTALLTLRLDIESPAPVRLPSRIRCTRDSAQIKSLRASAGLQFQFQFQLPAAAIG